MSKEESKKEKKEKEKKTRGNVCRGCFHTFPFLEEVIFLHCSHLVAVKLAKEIRVRFSSKRLPIKSGMRK